MHKQLRHHLKDKLLLNWEIVLNMIVKDLQILKCLRMQRDLLKQVLSDLMILDHSKHTNFPT